VEFRIETRISEADRHQSLAWIEMRMVLASLLFNFDLLEVQSDSRDWIDRQKIFFLWEKLPLNIRIRSRSSA
jgi:cytochrome P450